MTVTSGRDGDEQIEAAGRVALVTQGVLYAVVGVLAVQVGRGDASDTPSQRGAISAVGHQPFGRVLLVVLAIGLAAHALWRFALAARGEPGGDDGGSLAKRAANVGRGAVYVGFTIIAVRVLTSSSGTEAEGGSGGGSGSGGSGGGQRRSTATVLDWPGGRWLVIAAGLAVIGVAGWNLFKAAKRSFLEHLDLSGRSEGQRRGIEVAGAFGYAARGVVFGLVGWFLLQAGLTHDPDKAKSLDGALLTVARGDHGSLLLGIVAVGLVCFGAFRVVDGLLRRPSDIAWS